MPMFEDVPAIESPCVNICRMDRRTGWCIGCGRSIDEIVRWGSTDDGDRSRVIHELPARMARLRKRGPGS